MELDWTSISEGIITMVVGGVILGILGAIAAWILKHISEILSALAVIVTIGAWLALSAYEIFSSPNPIIFVITGFLTMMAIIIVGGGGFLVLLWFLDR